MHLRAQPVGLARVDRQPGRRRPPARAVRARAGDTSWHRPDPSRARTGPDRRGGGTTPRPGARSRRVPTARLRAGRRRRRHAPSGRRCPPRPMTSPAGRRCHTATMCSRMYVMSVVTLRAKPCIVRPCARRTPIAAILRGVGPADVDPDTRIPAEPSGAGQAELGEGIDQQRFDRHDVAERALCVGDREDRIADELPGTVIRDVAAAVDGDEVGADRGRVATQVGGEVGALAVGEHVIGCSSSSRCCSRPWSNSACWTASASRYGTRPSHRTRTVKWSQLGGPVPRLEDLLDLLQEAGCVGAVEGAMVPAHRQVADGMDGDRFAAVGGVRRRPACGRWRRWR